MASSTEFLKISGHEFEKTLGDSEGQGSWHAAVHGVAKSWTRLSDGTELKIIPKFGESSYFGNS